MSLAHRANRLSWRWVASIAIVALVMGAAGTIGTVRGSSGWIQQNAPTPAAGPLVYDTSRHVALLFNGTQTWQWSTAATTWTQKLPVHLPVMLGGDYAMAFDSKRGVAVLIVSPVPQGYPIVTNFLTTWEWDGVDWTQKLPAHAPTARYARSQNLAFDSFRGVTVLFSGEFNIQNPQLRATGDTWEWNGTDWTQNTTAGGSIMRDGHCMAYDSIRHRVVMHLGEENHGSGTSGMFWDTWEYDGAAWTLMNTDTTTFFQFAFGGCSLSYDPVIGRTIEIVGATPFYWDGKTWANVGPSFSGLTGLRSTYDPDNNTVVVIGSVGFSGANQTWLLNPLPPPAGLGPPPAITSILPDHGPAGGGTPVTISGSHFTGVTFLSFRSGSPGLTPCAAPPASQTCFTVDNDGQITAVSPSMFTVSTDVYVVGPGGFSATTPADVFVYEGWDPPTPADNTPINAPMTNPPQPIAFTVRLLEKGGGKIAYALPDWVTCTNTNNPPASGTEAQVDCTGSPTAPGPFIATFYDAVDISRVPIRTVSFNAIPVGYRPNPDGYPFQNIGDSTIDPLAIAADYPGSVAEMFYVNNAFTVKAAAFVPLFTLFQSSGLCYGMAVSSTFFYNDYPPGPLRPFGKYPSLDSKLPFSYSSPGTFRTLIERYHSRQLAEVGANEGILQYNAASALGNVGVYNQLVTSLRAGPRAVAIVPTEQLKKSNPGRWKDLFMDGHVVVAYDTATGTDPQGQTQLIIKVYNPTIFNFAAPGDPAARITIDPQGGLRLDGSTGVSYGNGTNLGQPSEWQAVPLTDFTWLDNSSELFGPFVIDNSHWIMDQPLITVPFMLGAAPATISGQPIFPLGGGSRAPVLVEQLAQGVPFSASLSTKTTNATVGQFSADHVAVTTETDPGAAGSTHSLDINTTSTSLHLYGSSSAQQYTLQLGADFLPNYGRQFTLKGVNLLPNGTVDFKTDANINGFTLSASGASQVVSATIEQRGQGTGTTTVQATFPGGGGQATITVFDWTDVAHSLIYETSVLNGQSTVTILQDNPTQRPAAIDALFQQLTAAISTITDPDLRQVLTVAVQLAQYFFHHGDSKTAAAILKGVEAAAKVLSGTKVPASTAASIISLSQQIRGLL